MGDVVVDNESIPNPSGPEELGDNELDNDAAAADKGDNNAGLAHGNAAA